MSVVQRCPNCGTTRATPGECEACHEAHVRYFCTNHTPGRWLDTSTCPTCGARLGDAPRVSAAASKAPPARPRSSAPPRIARTAASASARPPVYTPSVPPATRIGRWDSGKRLTSDFDDEIAPGESRMAPWQKMLLAALRARAMRSRTMPMREGAPVAKSVGGCLMRMLLVMALLLLALVSAVFLFGQVLLQGY